MSQFILDLLSKLAIPCDRVKHHTFKSCLEDMETLGLRKKHEQTLKSLDEEVIHCGINDVKPQEQELRVFNQIN
jgi:hypothetical protein